MDSMWTVHAIPYGFHVDCPYHSIWIPCGLFIPFHMDSMDYSMDSIVMILILVILVEFEI
jgi:hypothetical protein